MRKEMMGYDMRRGWEQGHEEDSSVGYNMMESIVGRGRGRRERGRRRGRRGGRGFFGLT